MPQLIKTQVDGCLATLTLARAPLNVLNIAMMREINEFLDSLKGNQALSLILIKAEGKAFSAGVDVGEHLGDLASQMIEAFHGIFRRLDDLGLVSVAQVQGAALGGGCELAIAADLVLASAKAKFGQPEIQVGVLPPIAALILPRVMGRKKAFELIVTGATIGAEEAARLGLVNHVAAPEELEAKTAELLAQLKALSPLVLRLTKKAFRKGLRDQAEEGLEKIEKVYLKELMTTHDAEEGLRAFLEKRPPRWENR